MAQFPNLLNHQTQDEAKAAIAASNFGQLLESGCSPDAGPLLCSALAPPCNGTQKPVLPCKGLCKRAMKGCRNQMKKFRITLTSAMRCRRLPKEGASECFDGSWPKNTLGNKLINPPFKFLKRLDHARRIDSTHLKVHTSGFHPQNQKLEQLVQ